MINFKNICFVTIKHWCHKFLFRCDTTLARRRRNWVHEMPRNRHLKTYRYFPGSYLDVRFAEKVIAKKYEILIYFMILYILECFMVIDFKYDSFVLGYK